MKLRELKSDELERAEVARIAQELTAAGWSVWVDFEVTPKAGKPARVDIMARKDDAVRLIEVKSKLPLSSRDDARISDLQRIATANGWQFELREVADPLAKVREIRWRIEPHLARLRECLGAISSNASQIEAEALRVYAIVLGTDILDALIRAKMVELGISPDPRTSSFLAAGVLRQQGAISPVTHHRLNQLRRFRNAALHPSVSPELKSGVPSHEDVVRILRDLLSDFGVSV
jgi:hypothetical protein